MDDKCFLVNLNADPALNELLVYYLKVFHQRSLDCAGPLAAFCSSSGLFLCVRRSTRVWALQIRRTSSCVGWPFKLSTASLTSQ